MNFFRYDTDDFWDCAIRYYTGPENHQCCSNKMGPVTDPMAVVDTQLSVHGIDGIRIMDASAMPMIVSGNTHATIVMMAERGVQLIKQRWMPVNTIDRGGFAPDSADSTGASSASKPSVANKPHLQHTLQSGQHSMQWHAHHTPVYHQGQHYQPNTNYQSQPGYYYDPYVQQNPNYHQYHKGQQQGYYPSTQNVNGYRYVENPGINEFQYSK